MSPSPLPSSGPRSPQCSSSRRRPAITNVPVDPPPQGVETPSATAPEEPAAAPAEIAQIPAQAAPPPEGRESVATGLQMKHRNPFAVWIGLPLITLGIYTYVWY